MDLPEQTNVDVAPFGEGFLVAGGALRSREVMFTYVRGDGVLLRRWTLPLPEMDRIWVRLESHADRPITEAIVIYGREREDNQWTALPIDPTTGPGTPRKLDGLHLATFENADRLLWTSHELLRESVAGSIRWHRSAPWFWPSGATIVGNDVYIRSQSPFRSEPMWPWSAWFVGVSRFDQRGRYLSDCAWVEAEDHAEVVDVIGDLVLLADWFAPPSSARCRAGGATTPTAFLRARAALLGAGIQGGRVRVVFRTGPADPRLPIGPGTPPEAGWYVADLDEELTSTTPILIDRHASDASAFDEYGNVLFLDDGGIVLVAGCGDAGLDRCLMRTYPGLPAR